MRSWRYLLVWAVLCAVLLSVAQLASAGPQVIWGPMLGDVTPTSLRITWRTNIEAQGQVLMDGLQPVATPVGLYHATQLLNLAPGHTYTYRVRVVAGSQAGTTPKYSFTTPPRGLAHFSFVTYGDTQGGPLRHRRDLAAMLTHQPAFILHTGDLTNDGNNLSEWKSFFGVVGRAVTHVPFYPTLGNHEHNALTYYQIMPLPRGGGDWEREWYSFTWGNCFFLALDGNRRLDEQAQWARRELARVPANIKWRIAFFHEPPFSSGPHGPSQAIAATLVPVLEAGGVNLVFSGHDHGYQRSRHGRTTYIVDAGGGGGVYPLNVHPNPYQQFAKSTMHFCLVEVSPTQLTVKAITPDGVQFDQVTLK